MEESLINNYILEESEEESKYKEFKIRENVLFENCDRILVNKIKESKKKLSSLHNEFTIAMDISDKNDFTDRLNYYNEQRFVILGILDQLEDIEKDIKDLKTIL